MHEFFDSVKISKIEIKFLTKTIFSFWIYPKYSNHKERNKKYVWWHARGNLILIQITSRMYHVQVVFSNVILLCIIMEDCATYLKKPALLIITKGGWLGKELLRVQTKFKYNKVVNADFSFPKNVYLKFKGPLSGNVWILGLYTLNKSKNWLKSIYSFSS